jgi:hypothetical protein
MTLLSVVQTACDELALPRPLSLVNSSDDQIRQLTALVNREGKELVKRHTWAVLNKEASIVTVAAQDAYALPSDFDRFIDQTFWDRSQRRAVMGPDTAQMWQWRQSEQVASEFYRQFRIRGTAANNLLIFPTPGDSGQTLYFEYISRNWARSAADAEQSSMSLDTDYPVFDEDLMVLGVIWRFLRAKGLDYADYLMSYQARYGALVASDGGGAQVLATTRHAFDLFPVNIPDGDWPGTGNP